MFNAHRMTQAVLATAAVTVASVGLSTAPAQAAAAGSVKVTGWGLGSQVVFTAAKGQANSIVVTRSGRTVTVDDRVAVRAGKGCKAVRGDRTKVRCTAGAGETLLRFALGDRNDRFVNRTSLSGTVRGGTGRDNLAGGSGDDFFFADSGTDRLVGNAGDDLLLGGTGDDVLDAGAGTDTMDGGTGADVLKGGSGRDEVRYDDRRRAVTVDLDGSRRDDGERGERDSVAADVEDVSGGYGPDVLTGNGSRNVIWGSGGNDVIRGRGGNDVLLAGLGNDRVHGDAGNDRIFGEPDFAAEPEENPGSDRARDRVDGGSNTSAGDECFVRKAGVAVNCERRASTI
jgi:Ca2+-binding RTX toxin-like protein